MKPTLERMDKNITIIQEVCSGFFPMRGGRQLPPVLVMFHCRDVNLREGLLQTTEEIFILPYIHCSKRYSLKKKSLNIWQNFPQTAQKLVK